MRTVAAVARREIQANFVSPIAYAFMALFLAVTAAGFLYGLLLYSLMGAALAEQRGLSLRTNLIGGPNGLVQWANIAIMISLPGLSMRLFSEEKKSGTIELLFTSPVTTVEMVLGKFLGALVVYAAILVLTLPYIGILAFKGNPELPAVAVAYLGLFLYGAVVLAVGLFASSLTENQFVALVIAYAILVPFLLMELLVGFAGPLFDPILAALSLGAARRFMALGLLDTQFLVVFCALIFVFLFLSARVLDSGRWR